MAFTILVVLLIGIGYLGLSRMNQINSDLNDVLGKHWTIVRLSRQALAYSSRNSRTTMMIFLVRDKQGIEPLLKIRAETTQRISGIITAIESQCDTREEKQRLAAVKNARTPYQESYLEALHLLVDEHNPDAARSVIVEKTTRALYEYHTAWENFAQFQMEEIDEAARESRARYDTASILVMALIGLAVLVAVLIAVFATRKMAREIKTRRLAEREVRELNARLEQRVGQRTRELAESNQLLTSEVAERKVAQERLHLQAAALEAAANAIVITDVTGEIRWVNSAFTRLTGYSKEEVSGRKPQILKSGKHSSEFYENLWRTIKSGNVWHGEVTNRRKDGSLYEEEMTITPVRSDRGELTHFVAIKQDVSARKASEEALWRAEEKYRTIFEDAVVGIFQMTPDGRPLNINRALAEMHGYDSPEELLAEISNVGKQLFVDPSRQEEWKQALAAEGVVRGTEVEVYRKDRSKKWVLVNVRAVRDAAGNIIFHEGTVEDITDRKLAEQQVQFLAYYDALSELPNRTLLQDRLSKALAGARRRKDKVALLFLDLDRFKIINDSLGHSVGDLLLQEVAKRLKAWARDQDTVARVGGDEFVIVLNGIKDVADAAVAAERVVRAMTAGYVIRGHSLSITCSLGISMFPEHGVDGETLIKNADAAMYCAKESGRNNFRFFTEDMNAQVVERLTLENSLRQALERDELFLVYQPQMNMTSGEITGLETLLRWQHPELGLVPPDRFIRIAENSGLIMPIGEWTLRTACSQVRAWQDQGLPRVPVAINVSAVQFRQEGFCDLIRTVLQETRLDPQYLELELTESLLLTNADVTLSVLQELKAMGLKLAIDDFGTGYSSLSYLKQFPVCKLKIDRSFVRDVAMNPDDAAITTAIISMAKSLNLKVIAEGVENEAQASFLRARDCDEIQGYYLSKPLAAAEITGRSRDGKLRFNLAARQGAGSD